MVSAKLTDVIERIKELKPCWEITEFEFNVPGMGRYRELSTAVIKFRRGRQIIAVRYSVFGSAHVEVVEEKKVGSLFDRNTITVPVFEISAVGMEEIDYIYDFIKDSIIEEYNRRKKRFDREREKEQKEREKMKNRFWNG